MKEENANVNIVIAGAIALIFGIFVIFIGSGVILPSMIETSSDISGLHAPQRIMGEDFIGDYTPVALDNAPIVVNSERVYSNYTWSEYNCTAPTYAWFERADENATCTCGCEDSIYKTNVSWWEWEETPETWTECIVDYDYQQIGPPEENYTCDCGCTDDEYPYPWNGVIGGVYDWNETNQTYDYNFTICVNWEQFNWWYDDNNTLHFTTGCNMSEFYNMSMEPCVFENVTDYEILWDIPCGDEDCGCNDNDSWYYWQTSVTVTECNGYWNDTNCTCYETDEELAELPLEYEEACVDSDYNWFYWNVSDEEECPIGDLYVWTACNPQATEWTFVEGTYCFNESNWLEWPEFPPEYWWFYSECVEGGEGEYNESDYTMNYEEGEINITRGGNMFEDWLYFIDYNIRITTEGYALRERTITGARTAFNVLGLSLFLAGLILIISQFTSVFTLFGKRGGGF